MREKEKKCEVCQEVKPIEKFSQIIRGGLERENHMCKACFSVQFFKILAKAK